MSHLPGNPFAELIEPLAGQHAEVAVALALAYEQRTANLIAYVVGIDDTSAAIPVVNEIRARLGIGATK